MHCALKHAAPRLFLDSFERRLHACLSLRHVRVPRLYWLHFCRPPLSVQFGRVSDLGSQILYLWFRQITTGTRSETMCAEQMGAALASTWRLCCFVLDAAWF